MVKDNKLEALSRRLDVVEQQIVETKQSTIKILEERESLLQNVIVSCQDVEAELESFRDSKRTESIRGGDVSGAKLICSLEKKLEGRIKELRKVIDERTTEVSRARERLASINEELTENRSANKRLDRLLERREQVSRMIRYAGDEMAQDELSKKGNK